MAVPVYCRACEQTHDPLRPCPQHVNATALQMLKASKPHTIQELVADKFDKVAYQREYMRAYRARKKAKGA